MYRITEEIKAYYSIYEFVSEINKDEVKRYDAFTWFYREKEEDNTDKTISIIIFCFKGAIHVPVLDSMSYLELERFYMNEQAYILNKADIYLRTAIDFYKNADVSKQEIIDELVSCYNADEQEEEENAGIYAIK